MRWLMVFLLVVGGCKPKPEKVEVVGENEFTTTDWEELTEELMRHGKQGNVQGFKSRVSKETIEMFDESWAPIVAKCDMGLKSGKVAAEDRDKLLQLKQTCSWEALAAGYRPGRLMTIAPEPGGKYRVKEILPGGRKVDYLVRKEDRIWIIEYDRDSRWFRELEAVAHSVVNSILERNGLGPEPRAEQP